MRKLTVFLVLFMVVLIPVTPVYAWPSSDFHEEGDDIFDDWHVCRTSGWGEYGFLGVIETETGGTTFRPLLPLESLGEYTDTAYRLGEQFADKYPDRHQRAEKIFEYARDKMQYTRDSDQWGMNEFAQNADEVANTLQEDGIANGDCEEFAVLQAVMYQGAGFRSAIIICPGHVAVLVHLPGYGKAMRLKLEGEPGWVWAEATAKTNTFGWFPKELLQGPILGREVFPDEHLDLWQPPDEKELPPAAPVLNPIGNKSVNVNELLRFTISATGGNDDPLTYSVSNLPEGASFAPETQTFSWIPDKAGTYRDIHFEVSDGTLADSEDITITVFSAKQPLLSEGGPNIIVMALPFFIVVGLLIGIILLFRRR